MRKTQLAKIAVAADKLAGMLIEAEMKDVARDVLCISAAIGSASDYMNIIRTKPLVEALWWFIENVSEDHPMRTQLFFALRVRARTEQEK